MSSVFSRSILLYLLFLIPSISFSQITTSEIKGYVIDEQDLPTPGSTVLLIHQPTGSKYTETTDINGKFYFPNLRPGGPYVLTIQLIGFKSHYNNQLYLFFRKNKQAKHQANGRKYSS